MTRARQTQLHGSEKTLGSAVDYMFMNSSGIDEGTESRVLMNYELWSSGLRDPTARALHRRAFSKRRFIDPAVECVLPNPPAILTMEKT